ncbi:hypothetical protein [Halomonas sp. LBP4]|uniref:hypothetical protein n=1 Tax=Halomonas sp. LBP4 TaxID=2044917 RepID=UPI000D76D29A|nr:hypothetical protein [Halomonas sp. LBP4]PXX95810.1 hypothetical protein CR157_16535 [Halomonas sp. LBP4]
MSNCHLGSRTEQTLLELSTRNQRIEALAEWRYAGLCHDYEMPIAYCELCKASHQRFRFRLDNAHNRRRIWVGSGCILGHAFRVEQNGVVLNQQAAERHINDTIQGMLRDAVVSRLLIVVMRDTNDLLAEALVHYQQTGHLTPRHAAIFFDAIEREGIDTEPAKFHIYLRRQTDQMEMRSLATWRVWRFWHTLTPAQKKQACELGHRPPPNSHVAVRQHQSKGRCSRA